MAEFRDYYAWGSVPKTWGESNSDINDIIELQKEIKRAKEATDNIVNDNIAKDLEMPRFEGSEKPLYTYEDVASKNGVSKSRVQRVAEKRDLTRRK